MNTWTDTPLLLRLMLTEQCNLRCRYCYADKRDVWVSDEVLDNLAALIEREMHKGRRLSVELTGGEPLLQWERLEAFVQRLRSMEGGADLPVMIITNGVLMTSQRSARLAELDVALRLSMDGGRVEHMAHRRAVQPGEEYFPELMDHARQALEQGANVTVNMVVSPATVSRLVDSYMHLYDLTGRYVKISPAIGVPWSNGELDVLDERLGRLGRLLLRHGRRFATHAFCGDLADDLSHAAYVLGEAPANPGMVSLTIDPEGMLYRDEFEPRTRRLLALETLSPHTDPGGFDLPGEGSMQLVYNRRLYPDDVLQGQQRAYTILREHLGGWYASLSALQQEHPPEQSAGRPALSEAELAALIAPLKPRRQRIAGYQLTAVTPGELPSFDFEGPAGSLRIALLPRADAPNAWATAGRFGLVVKSEGELRGMDAAAKQLIAAVAKLVAANDQRK